METAHEWSLHMTVDKHLHPEFAWLSRDDEHLGARWVADCEFGPFDTLLDVYRWLQKALRTELRPSGM